mmetsp:Transcript_8686/g.13726  ORF Transcript_8686/g.13726 Transcript_8686/m.13726 type:complete len:150 (-) Transcript_8686:484-933(-)
MESEYSLRADIIKKLYVMASTAKEIVSLLLLPYLETVSKHNTTNSTLDEKTSSPHPWENMPDQLLQRIPRSVWGWLNNLCSGLHLGEGPGRSVITNVRILSDCANTRTAMNLERIPVLVIDGLELKNGESHTAIAIKMQMLKTTSQRNS